MESVRVMQKKQKQKKTTKKQKKLEVKGKTFWYMYTCRPT